MYPFLSWRRVSREIGEEIGGLVDAPTVYLVQGMHSLGKPGVYPGTIMAKATVGGKHSGGIRVYTGVWQQPWPR